MPSVPAFCDSCGAIFESGFFVENSSNITFSNNLSGPCPVCGGMGHIPDGVFNFVGNTIEILSAPQRTVEELTRLVHILQEARKKAQTTDEVISKINHELPNLSKLTELLPQNRSELYGFLAVILAALQLMLQSPTSSPSSHVTINVNQVVQQATTQSNQITTNITETKHARKTGRNEPCPCGSGKKYKKCCGK